jgi:hypothetical protein
MSESDNSFANAIGDNPINGMNNEEMNVIYFNLILTFLIEF